MQLSRISRPVTACSNGKALLNTKRTSLGYPHYPKLLQTPPLRLLREDRLIVGVVRRRSLLLLLLLIGLQNIPNGLDLSATSLRPLVGDQEEPFFGEPGKPWAPP